MLEHIVPIPGLWPGVGAKKLQSLAYGQVCFLLF